MTDTTIVIEEDLVEVSALSESIEVGVTEVIDGKIEIIEEVKTLEILEPDIIEVLVDQEPDISITISEGGTGNFDPNTARIPKLSITKIYSETISALKPVSAVNLTQVKVADNDTFSNSKVMGIAVQAGILGFEGLIHIFGILEDASFNFPVNDVLYVGFGGVITNVPPAKINGDNYSTTIGYSLGAGAIFVNIQEPIEL